MKLEDLANALHKLDQSPETRGFLEKYLSAMEKRTHKDKQGRVIIQPEQFLRIAQAVKDVKDERKGACAPKDGEPECLAVPASPAGSLSGHASEPLRVPSRMPTPVVSQESKKVAVQGGE